MFGFLNPRPHSREYRRVYARLCQHQHLHYGLWSLAFHSYEAVFLYQCAVDAGIVDQTKLPAQRCCKLMTRGSIRNAPDAEVGRFCASFALLLASIKLEDDIRDSRGLIARLGRWMLRRRLAMAQHYFTRLDPQFAKNVRQLLADHAALERPGKAIDLEAYTAPTARSFAYVFGLMAKLPGMSKYEEVLTNLGHKLGTAIIAFDAAVDWKRDRQRGEFNPLPDEEAVRRALRMSARHLEEAAQIARRAFPKSAHAATTLETVHSRILRRNPLVEGVRCEPARVSFWTRLKHNIRLSFQTKRYAAFAPIAFAMASEGNSEEPLFPSGIDHLDDATMPPPEDGEAKDAPATSSQQSSGPDCYCGDCGNCGECADCSGCDCNC